MLGKLIKYEFRATGRSYCISFLVMLLSALSLGLISNGRLVSSSSIQLLLTFLVSALLVTTFIIVMRCAIRVFTEELFGRPGYLNLTLPVSAEETVLARIIVIVVWSLAAVLVSLACVLIFEALAIQDLAILWQTLTAIFADGWGYLNWLAELGTAGLAAYSLVGLCVTLAHSGLPRKGRAFYGVLIFFAISFTAGWATQYLPSSEPIILIFSPRSSELYFFADPEFYLNLGLAAVYYFITVWLLKHKSLID